MKKKFVAVVLCLVMVLTFAPTLALAEGDKIQETLNLNLGTYNSEPGQNPTYINDSIDCEKYYVRFEQWYNITDMEHLTEDKTFEAGKLYEYSIYIKPYQEYEFTEDSQIIINGVVWNGSWMTVSDSDEAKGEFVFWGYYTPGLKAIKNVDLTIDNMEAGKPLVFVEGVPESANCTINEQQWSEYDQELPQGSIYSEEGGYYNYYIILDANEGYRFTTDTTVTVNGIEWERISSGGLYDEQPGNYLQAGFFGSCTLWPNETEEETTESTTEVATESTTAAPIDTPETGSTDNATLWISLMCIALGAFATVMAVRVKKQ